MNTKSLLESKVFWVAVVQATFGAFLVFTSAYPSLETFGFVAILKSGLDIILRVLTTSEITSVSLEK